MALGIAPDLVSQCQEILQGLVDAPFPILPSPDATPRRASVAFIIRIKPSYASWPSDSPRPQDLQSFFTQTWVKHGDPEVLFIKRASRKGDRWTSHVALPGGRRDPEDADDEAAAVRETWEEVGIDLEKYALPAGNLPQRLVTTHWGKKPLMVLCPYVFVLTSHDIPPLRLQPTEVAATHWVPLRSLQSPVQRTVALEDVSSRLANQETGVKKWMLSLILGKMVFAAINLVPSESLHSVETPDPNAVALQDNRMARTTWSMRASNLITRMHRSDVFGQYLPPPKEGPLLLWGLTLGVISDFLDLLPPHDALTLWTYPTFTPLDVRFCIWLLTCRFKERKRIELQAGTTPLRRPIFGGVTESLASSSTGTPLEKPNETGFHGLGTGSVLGTRLSKKAAVATMLEGSVNLLVTICLPVIADRARYYDIVRRAVRVALFARFGLATALILFAWRKYHIKK